MSESMSDGIDKIREDESESEEGYIITEYDIKKKACILYSALIQEFVQEFEQGNPKDFNGKFKIQSLEILRL